MSIWADAPDKTGDGGGSRNQTVIRKVRNGYKLYFSSRSELAALVTNFIFQTVKWAFRFSRFPANCGYKLYFVITSSGCLWPIKLCRGRSVKYRTRGPGSTVRRDFSSPMLKAEVNMESTGNPIICAHGEAEKTGRACEHLLKKVNLEYYNSSEHFRFFTGRDIDFVLLCSECAKHPEASEIYWRTICDSCVRDIACGTRMGELGSPEIRRRDVGLKLLHQPGFDHGLDSPVIAAAPRGMKASGEWLLLTQNGELVLLNTGGQSVNCATLPLKVSIEAGLPFSLCVSRDGRFAAIASTYGQTGIVVDLEEVRVLMNLTRGTYLNEHCRFPLIFAEHSGKPVLVHATEWNRLDVTELPSGRMLTTRERTSYCQGQDRPAHYLDYFQCSLAVSPDDKGIVSNGWIWHPVGVVAKWSLEKWLTENAWESEDGPSKKSLCWRDYYWDGPLCWIDERTIAVWGLGDDDILLIPGVRLFDAESGEEKFSFPGPAGGSQKENLQVVGKEQVFLHGTGTLIFDGWLFAWVTGKPFSAWDISDGAQVLEESDFLPLGYHRGSQEFLSLMLEGTMRISRVVGSTGG
jgi:hypothetical protein